MEALPEMFARTRRWRTNDEQRLVREPTALLTSRAVCDVRIVLTLLRMKR